MLAVSQEWSEPVLHLKSGKAGDQEWHALYSATHMLLFKGADQHGNNSELRSFQASIIVAYNKLCHVRCCQTNS